MGENTYFKAYCDFIPPLITLSFVSKLGVRRSGVRVREVKRRGVKSRGGKKSHYLIPILL